jgi:tape measure domain-containing protein
MARGNFNFKVKAGLDTKDFKRGISNMQSMMSKFQSSFASLAAGIGLGLGFDKLISEVKETAIKLDTAQNILRNVSKVTKTANSEFGKLSVTLDNYGNNLEFVKGLGEKYGQDVITLTQSYGQFIAACKNSSLSLQEQEHIFESITRAAGAFGMSEARMGDTMNAIIQMISKGKISMEELRRQLGNNLPGAVSIMAKAAGVSVIELERMISNGELLADKILPQFADELNKVTANAKFDNLQTSLNRFKNQWTTLVDKIGAKDIYKGLVDNATGALKHLADNTTMYATIIKYSLWGALGSGFASILGKSTQYVKNYRADLVKEYDFITKEIKNIQKAVGANRDAVWGGTLHGSRVGVGTKVVTTDKNLINEAIQYNNLLIQRGQLYTEITGIESKKRTSAAKFAAKQNALLNAQLAILNNTTTPLVAQKGFLNTLSIGWKGITGWIGKAFSSLNAMLGPIGWTIIAIQTISAIAGKIVGQVKQEREERERIAKLAEGSQDSINERIAPTLQENKNLQDTFDSFKNFFKSGNMSGAEQFYNKLKAIVPALNKISFEELKKKANAIDFVSNALDKYTQALKALAEVDAIQAQISTDNNKIAKKQKRIDEIKAGGKPLTEKKVFYDASGYEIQNVPTKLGQELNTLEKEIKALNQGVAANQAKIEAIKSSTDIDWKSLTGSDDAKPISPLAEILKAYKKDFKELKELYDEGAITAEDYSEKLNKLNKKAYESAIKDSDLSINDIIKKVANEETLTTLEQFYYNLATAVATATADVAYKKVLKELDKEIKKLDKEIDDEIEKLNKWNKFQKEKIGPRDTTFDYKKSNVDKAADEYDYYTQKVEEAKKEIELLLELFKNGWNDDGLKQLKTLQGNLDLLTKQAKSWKEAMALEEMAEDLRNFQKELNSIGFNFMDYGMGGLNGVVSTIDGLVSAFERIKELSEDVDATGWEKFMASWGVFETIMDGVFNTFSAVNAIMELTNSLTDIQNKKKATLNALLMQENALKTANAAITTTAAGAATANASATATEAAAAAANTKAKSKEAIANVTASAAKLPTPFNILAISAGVAAVIAALAAVSKFETGGIVGGNSTRGDKNLVRVNSGEMILNKAQQATLWNMLNGKGGVGGNVQFKIKGADLIGVMNNEMSRRRG